jgi:hypothetical protein
MPIVRKRLVASEVYPDDIRYNPSGDQVEVLIDGVWTPAPESDPRKQTTLPPRITADPACDGARSIADALQNQISSIATAIDNAQTVAQIAALILGLFSFGVFAIFINIALAIAGYMLDAGTAAIEAALPPSAYDTLTCILSCHMNAQGRINPGELSQIQSEVGDQIGGLGSGILNDMMNLAGEGGLNNLAAAGTSTGDCDACGCVNEWCFEFLFTASNGGWTATFGTWTAGQGWVATTAGTGKSIILNKTFTSTVVKHIEINVLCANTCNISIVDGPTTLMSLSNQTTGMYENDGTWTVGHLTLNPSSGAAQGANVTMTRLLLSGTGDNPFGLDNCEA